jgi:hypothetical protein
MIKDIFSQIGSAQNVLLSLNTKRLSFVYLVVALNKAFKEMNIQMKIYCQNSEIVTELQNLDIFIQDQFIDSISLDPFDLALFFGDISNKQIDSINAIKTIKHAYFLNFKRDNKENKIQNLFCLDGSYIQFFFDLLESIKFNNNKEIYTLLLTSILLESNNLSNAKTLKHLKLVTLAIDKGGILSIAQNFLDKKNLQDV